mmetsp:Transcript_55383/g.121348  ORF Transcript_55383/g.121348 Transcript_55383/m.121348 type:complete len:261 (-) Transcript_55383:39-821(-)
MGFGRQRSWRRPRGLDPSQTQLPDPAIASLLPRESAGHVVFQPIFHGPHHPPHSVEFGLQLQHGGVHLPHRQGGLRHLPQQLVPRHHHLQRLGHRPPHVLHAGVHQGLLKHHLRVVFRKAQTIQHPLNRESVAVRGDHAEVEVHGVSQDAQGPAGDPHAPGRGPAQHGLAGDGQGKLQIVVQLPQHISLGLRQPPLRQQLPRPGPVATLEKPVDLQGNQRCIMDQVAPIQAVYRMLRWVGLGYRQIVVLPLLGAVGVGDT